MINTEFVSTHTLHADIKQQLMNVVDALSLEKIEQLLEFATFLRQRGEKIAPPVQKKFNTRDETLRQGFPTVAEIVALIQNTPPNPNNITGSNDLLAERLANPMGEADPNFDLDTWRQEWDRVEAMMEADDLAHELAEQREIFA